LKSRTRGAASAAIASSSAGAACCAFTNAYAVFDSSCALNSVATSALLAASAFQTRLSGANLVALTTLASPYTAVETDRGSKSGSFCCMESSNGASALLRRSSAFIHSHSSRLWRTSLPRVLQQLLISSGRIWSAWRSWACST
jgi:hypothetical protein